MIPVLIIGAFALIIKTFPVDGYQTFITTFGDGFIYSLFDLIYAATFGVLSVYMTFSISRSYMKIKADSKAVNGGAVIAALLSIDDFSMGKTSINYLKDSLFDEIKLDGSLVKGLFEHQNCREIIQSITQLAASLDLAVLAEYVETEEQRDVLHEIGYDCYQGYLYSPAVFLDEQS